MEARQTSLARRLSAFFLDPPAEEESNARERPQAESKRAQENDCALPVERVAVVGLSPGCGATTVSLALAAALADRSPARVAVLASCDPPRVTSLGRSLRRYRAAAMLQAELAARGMTGIDASHLGPVCCAQVPCSATGDLVADPFVAALAALVGGRAPLVWDIAAGVVELLEPALRNADATALVAGDRSDPELVRLAREHLVREAGNPLVVMNGRDKEAELDAAELDAAGTSLPRSRLAVWRLRAGRPARGTFAQAAACLADRCVDAAADR